MGTNRSLRQTCDLRNRSVNIVRSVSIPLAALFLAIIMTTNDDTSYADEARYALAVHGGAMGNAERLTDQQRAQREQSLRIALTTGRDILQRGGSSLDAVEQVIRHLEDDPQFNAGRGSVLNRQGEHEMDASIMDGSNLACGAVAGVRTVRNPISLARRVMTETRHVLFAGPGAEQLAEQLQVPREPLEYFRTEEQIERWKKLQANTDGHMGTVGCVALDQHGNLAAGTSTGGVTNKMVGRVGDSPVIGAGTYADNATCAVSCTGTGEEFIRRAAAYDVSALMRYRQCTLDEAVRQVVDEKLPDGSGAMISVSHRGEISMRYNTAGLARAAADSAGRFEVIVGP